MILGEHEENTEGLLRRGSPVTWLLSLVLQVTRQEMVEIKMYGPPKLVFIA